MTGLLTISRAREILSFVPETGAFERNGKLVTPTPDRKGYLLRNKIDWRLYKLHRLAWLLAYGKWPEDQLDHANGIPSDNRLTNLREATNSQNAANRGLFRNTTSGLKGVTWYPRYGKWMAQTHVLGKRRNLGYFDCPAAAHFSYVAAADKAFGEFAMAARLPPPPPPAHDYAPSSEETAE